MINLKGNYLVEKDGRIYSFYGKGQYLNPTVNAEGYCVVSITVDGVKNQYKVHQLVAEAFVPNPEGKECIHHKDRNKLNNSADNLQWVTREEHSALHSDPNDPAYVYTKEFGEKQSMAKKGQTPWNKGKKNCYTEETIKRMSEARKGMIITAETRKKISEANSGRPQSEEHKRKRAESKKRPVAQYDKENNFIKEWKSALDAEQGCGVSRCHIATVCKGKRQSAGGYIWRYV
jgi:hypothetical protein